MAAQPSAAGEAGASDGTTPPTAGAVAEPASSEEREGADEPRINSEQSWEILERASDPRIDPEERQTLVERAVRLAKEEIASREAAARSASIRGVSSMPRKDWSAPLPELVYECLLAEMEAEHTAIPPMQMMGGRRTQAPPDPMQAAIPDWRPPPAPNDPLGLNRPSLSELVSDRILYDTREPTAPLMAAIELQHNKRSFELLLKYGLKNYVKVYGHSDGGQWNSPAVVALWFLRTYDPTDEARAEVEKALALDLRQSQGEGPVASQAAERAKCLRSLLASWDFAQGLGELGRKAYQEYERRRWMTRALTASRRNRPTGAGAARYSRLAAAAALCPWPDGDEDFFLRNFESPASTEEDVRLAGVEAFLQPDGTYRFSDEGIRRLEAVAKGTSFRAKEAARLLPLLKNEAKP